MRKMTLGLPSLLLCLATGCNGKDAQLGEGMEPSSSPDAALNHDGAACTPPQDSSQDSGFAPAYCFACGSAATCDGRVQVCDNVNGGVGPGVDTFQCVAIPAVCASNVSCACLIPALAVTSCSADGSNVTVYDEVP
jgi:hypothetical protein